MDNNDDDDTPELDREAIERDIAEGQKLYRQLLKNADLEWGHWYGIIVGLRGLRLFAAAKAGTGNMQSQAFRDAMQYLLGLQKYSTFAQMENQDRSDCYRLMDRLEDIDLWYEKIPATQKLRWKHPGTIAKHCPPEYLSSHRRHNVPKKGKKKPVATAETERLKALLIQVIQRLAKHEPEALKLLDEIYPDDPDDGLDDV